jgi:DNA-binding IscR family transcriptional regulator
VLEVVNAADGTLSLHDCVLRGTACSVDSICAVHEFWVEAQQAFAERIAATTFAMLSARESELAILPPRPS